MDKLTNFYKNKKILVTGVEKLIVKRGEKTRCQSLWNWF